MKPSEAQYHKMLLEPEVPTPVFHKVLAALLRESADEEAVTYMEELLHLPDKGAIGWQEHAIQLARKNMIATMTEAEVMDVWKDDEEPQEWDVLAKRVIEERCARSRATHG